MKKSQSIVFICAPLRDFVNTQGRLCTVEENIQDAKSYGDYCVNALGYRKAFVPHNIATFLDARNAEEDSLGAVMSMAALGMCHAVAVCGEYVSPGMRREIERAESLGIYTVGVPKETISAADVADTPAQAGSLNTSAGTVESSTGQLQSREITGMTSWYNTLGFDIRAPYPETAIKRWNSRQGYVTVEEIHRVLSEGGYISRDLVVQMAEILDELGVVRVKC